MLQGMFGQDDFREDGKKIMKNMRENEWEGCLVEREREGEKNSRVWLFSPQAPLKLNLLKTTRK